MSAMEQTHPPSQINNLIRWFVLFAAILAFGVWFYIAPPGLLGKADAIGYAICHRIDERSFQIGDRQLPLCARCTGEFYAAGISLIFFALVSKGKSGIYTVYGTVGSGKVFVFQDGTVTEGTWTKADRGAQWQLTDGTGQPIALNPGQTWFTMIDTPGSVSYQ